VVRRPRQHATCNQSLCVDCGLPWMALALTVLNSFRLFQGDPHAAMRVTQVLAACALLVVCVVFQPKHKEVELFQRRAAVRALKTDDLKNRAMMQSLSADMDVINDGWGNDDVDENAPPPEDIMAIQGAQAGSIIGLDYLEATAAAGAATAAAAAPELIPLMALRQKQKQQQLRTVNAPFRLSGYTLNPYDSAQQSADPWTGDPSLSSVKQVRRKI